MASYGGIARISGLQRVADGQRRTYVIVCVSHMNIVVCYAGATFYIIPLNPVQCLQDNPCLTAARCFTASTWWSPVC